MTLNEIISLLKTEGRQLLAPIQVGEMQPMVFDCVFAEHGACKSEASLISEFWPVHIKQFWGIAEWAKIFEDQTYGQSGLYLLKPSEALEESRNQMNERPQDLLAGDLIIGRFFGDSDLLLVRTDENKSDFGKILISLPLDPRDNWYNVADSFEQFLERFVKARGQKYWEIPNG